MAQARRGALGVVAPPPGTVQIGPAALVNDVRATYRNLGWVSPPVDESLPAMQLGPGWGPMYNYAPTLHPNVPDQLRSVRKQNFTQAYLYNDPPDMPAGLALFRLQAIVRKTPAQYGTDGFALGHYAPFFAGVPVRSIAPFVESSGFQPISRGGHVLVSLTESNVEGGPAATARRFANTRLGLWFKSWVVGGANVRPYGSRQTPSPQLRGVLPNYGYLTLPRVIGS
jgi:hypothetical protein